MNLCDAANLCDTVKSWDAVNLCGDFLQLPPVPASASLWAGSGRMSATLREQRRCWLRWAGAGATPEPSPDVLGRTGPTDRDGWTDGETERTGRDETRQDGTGRSPGREGGGREIHVPYTSRCCWKQVRLGRASEETQQQKGLSGNTIFFAQPTAEVPSMELPPAPDGLVDTVNIILTRSVDDLRHAEWATVKRSEYMRIVRERKAQCPVFSEVKLADETRLPECGVPEHITACASTVEGAERAPSRLLGPASRAPEISKYEEADEATDASDSHDDKDAPVSARGACQPADGQDAGPDAAATGEGIAEASIAIDPTHHLKPAKMMQALRAQLDAVQAHAAKVWRDSEAAPYHTHPG